jgi:hypothetical protein
VTQKVLRFTQDLTAAKEEIAKFGGRLVHEFSPAAFVAELPDWADPAKLTASTAVPTQPLDQGTKLAVTAWSGNRQIAGAAALRAAPPPSRTEGLPWDTPGYSQPEFLEDAAAQSGLNHQESTDIPTSRYLIGSVAVGVVLVSRDQGNEAMTDDERTQILQQVEAGLDWIAGAEARAQVSFV